MNAYTEYFNSNSIFMNFLFHNKEIIRKYNEIWNRIKDLFGKEFNSEAIYGGTVKYIKSKLNPCNTNFYGINVSVKGKNYTQFSIISLDSIISVNGKYYPQILLKDCKYVDAQ